MSKPSIAATVYKLALAGQQAGFSLEQMIEMLDCGITVQTLLGLIESRLASHQWQEMPAETASSQWVM
jgi:hypothetical protein